MRRRVKAAIIVAALAPIVAAAVSIVLPMVSDGYRAKALARKLSSSDRMTVVRAQAQLTEIGGKAAPAVVDAVRDAVRTEARRGQSWAWFWRHMFGRHGGDWNGETMRTLLLIGEPAVPALEEALGDRDDQVRWWATRTLSVIKAPAADEAMARALSNPFEDVRRQAAWARGRAGDARAVPVLIADLQSEDARRRWTAAMLLQIIGTKEALAPLEDVVARCRTGEIAANYRDGIAAGDSEDVPLLVFCLERYGTEEMAADYFYSRQMELARAADAWAMRHGKSLAVEASDRAAVVWGEKRK